MNYLFIPFTNSGDDELTLLFEPWAMTKRLVPQQEVILKVQVIGNGKPVGIDYGKEAIVIYPIDSDFYELLEGSKVIFDFR